MKRITNDIYHIGVNDRKIDLFESQYPVPNGMAYNSYLINDGKIAVFDTVEAHFTDEWFENIKEVIGDKAPDYLIIQHMEPDHSANIMNFAKKYPTAELVGNAKTFKFMEQFFGDSLTERQVIVKEGDTLSLGRHELKFVMAPMVHWPEVMVTYDSLDRVLFSADAFGKFGASDIDEEWLDEARRYYIGIVGKYGMQVQALLRKAGALEIEKICSLHGPVLESGLEEVINKYNIWSSYGVEKNGVVLCYTSIYGHTQDAVMKLKDKLVSSGVDVKVYDLARDWKSSAVADAFSYGKVVLATTTYNNEIFPPMREFLSELKERGFQNRTVGIIENGSWAPQAAKIIKAELEGCKNITFCENTVTLKSALNDESAQQLEKLAEELK
ncbi:MAG: FprA family A-type flavoprotein [Ruminococcaceae bacterium]|nr:FprA family A-type flavoprotein [Oscillospiraceae bacterium]